MRPVILVILVIFGAFLSTGAETLPDEGLPPITITQQSFAMYLLSTEFGTSFVEDWTDEQMLTADNLFDCVEKWWEVATAEQLLHTPKMRVTWICWEKVRNVPAEDS